MNWIDYDDYKFQRYLFLIDWRNSSSSHETASIIASSEFIRIRVPLDPSKSNQVPLTGFSFKK